MPPAKPLFQQHQPEGVSALEMTGERTLPDVPQENYWYQRHVVVYEWVARRVCGKRVVDMACGEGYGSHILASVADEVVGVDANAQAYEHARLKYRRPNLRFARELVEDFAEPADAVVFLQTIEHVTDPDRFLRHFKRLVSETNGQVIISTPNVLTLAPRGQKKSSNPWHVREYRPDEFHDLLTRHFQSVDLFGLYNARKLALHARVIDILGVDRDAIHRQTGWARVLYPGFVSTINSKDFRLCQATDVDGLEQALDLVAVVRP
jgi:SAM-dependent methyltransferase